MKDEKLNPQMEERASKVSVIRGIIRILLVCVYLTLHVLWCIVSIDWSGLMLGLASGQAYKDLTWGIVGIIVLVWFGIKYIIKGFKLAGARGVFTDVMVAVFIPVVSLVVGVNVFADCALKAGIEVAAAKTLNVGVRLQKVDLSIMGGQLSLENLEIDNPPGYQHEKLLELKDAQIEVNVKSLLGDTVNIRRIKLDGVNVVLEQRGVSSNNLQDVVKTISDKQKAKAESKGSGKKLHIDELEISNITVKAKLIPVPGRVDTITLQLDPIVMTDLGSDNKLDTAGLSGRVLMAITRGIANKGTGVLPEEMTGAMKLTLGMTVELGKTAAEEGKKLLETGKDSGTEVIEGFKGLLEEPAEEKEEAQEKEE